MRKKPKNKQKIRLRIDGFLKIEGDNAGAFETWVQSLPSGHGPAISEWDFEVEIAKGIKAQLKVSVPSWDEYRAAQEQK